MICKANSIEHRLTKLNHSGSHEDQTAVLATVFQRGDPVERQIERMNRIIKDATVKRFHHDSQDPLRTHLAGRALRSDEPSSHSTAPDG